MRGAAVPLIFAVVAVAACGFGEIALDGKSCDQAARCVQGYTCDRGSNVCVRITGNVATLPDGAVVAVDPNGNIDPTIPVSSDGGSPAEGGLTLSDGAVVVPPANVAFDKEPSPTTARFNGVSVSLAGFAIAVGDGGVIVRRATTGTWSSIASPTTKELLSVTTDGSFVWAVGRAGAVVRSTDGGLTFTDVSVGSQDLYAVTGLPGEVYAAGAADTFLRGPSAGPVVAVAFPTVQDGPFTQTGLWAENPNTVHFVSSQGRLQTVDPVANSGKFMIGLGSASFVSVHGFAGAPPYAISRGSVFFFGNGFSSVKVSDFDLRSIWVKSASTMYAVGDLGLAFRRVGTNPWEPIATGTTEHLRSMHGAGTLTFAVGAGGTILKLK